MKHRNSSVCYIYQILNDYLPQEAGQLSVSEFCFQMKLSGMQEKEMCSPLRQLALFLHTYHYKKVIGEEKFDSQITGSMTENQICRGVYLLASLLGSSLFQTAMQTILYLFSMCFTFVYFTQGLSFKFPILCLI